MMSPLTKAAIKAKWMEQNPALVRELETNGMLTTRLDEAHETTSLVQGHAIQNGLSPDQAWELAMDAIGLPLPRADQTGSEDDW